MAVQTVKITLLQGQLQIRKVHKYYNTIPAFENTILHTKTLHQYLAMRIYFIAVLFLLQLGESFGSHITNPPPPQGKDTAVHTCTIKLFVQNPTVVVRM